MKYKVIKEFIDKYNPSITHKVGDILTISKERADEILSVNKLIEEVKEVKKEKKSKDRVVE